MHTGTLRACRCHLRQKQGQSRTSTQRSRARAALFASVLRPSCALPANVSIGSTVAQADRPQVPNMTASKADSAPHDVQPGFTGHAENVPATLSDALKLFVRHPSVISAVAIISTALATRLGHPIGFADIAVLLLASGTWVIQEWAIHKYLLHAAFTWLGTHIHTEHHTKPYHHVSIDGPELIIPFMLLTGGVFWVSLKQLIGLPLVLTACIGYWTTGLFSYVLVHYLVHTRWVPQSGFMRRVRRHHMLHHLRNHDNWFAFSVPEMDSWMGTAPVNPNAVPLKVHRSAAPTAHIPTQPAPPAE